MKSYKIRDINEKIHIIEAERAVVDNNSILFFYKDYSQTDLIAAFTDWKILTENK